MILGRISQLSSRAAGAAATRLPPELVAAAIVGVAGLFVYAQLRKFLQDAIAVTRWAVPVAARQLERAPAAADELDVDEEE